MNSSWAILIGAALIAGAIAISGRFEIVMSNYVAWRIDRWTGDILVCARNNEFKIVYCDRYTGRNSKGEQNSE